MEKRTSPKGFIVVLPGEIIEIPQDSDKSWLTLFYSLPRELAEKWKPAYDLPRCPYEVLRTDKYDHIVCDDMFKLLVWDCYEKHFRAVMEHKLLLSSEEKICASVKRLEQAQRRMGELDRLFIRIYEDNVAGRINDERFAMMSRSYETEQEQLKVEIQTLQQDIEVQERQIENLEQFIQRVHKYKDLDELTPYALRELVKGVYIEAPDKSSGKRRQNIRISYDLVGFIPLNELMKEGTA